MKQATQSAQENQPPSLPHHVAIIMDGNGRWATQRGLPRTAGHKAGVETLRAIVAASVELHIPVLTVFAFSSENWSRPRHEVQFLLDLISFVLQREIDNLHKENIKIRIIGDRDRFSPRLQKLIADAEQLTKNNTGLQFNVAVNYGGHWDITQATKRIAEKVLTQQLALTDINEQLMQNELCLAEVEPPDFLIRTSGEKRISNFLLWQLAYTELYFTDVLWPDFSKENLMQALQEYALRHRRFGSTTAETTTEQQVHHA